MRTFAGEQEAGAARSSEDRHGAMRSKRERPEEDEETGKRVRVAGSMSGPPKGEQEQGDDDAEMEDVAGQVMRITARNVPGYLKRGTKNRGRQGQLIKLKEDMGKRTRAL